VVGGGVLCLGGAGLVVILLVGAFLFWLYRLGTGEDEEFEDQEIEAPGD
jgi:hypothetical protein